MKKQERRLPRLRRPPRAGVPILHLLPLRLGDGTRKRKASHPMKTMQLIRRRMSLLQRETRSRPLSQSRRTTAAPTPII